MAELNDRVVTVHVKDSQGRYVAQSLVRLCVDGEPIAQAYTGDGPITIQATNSGELRVDIVSGKFEQSFPVDSELNPITVVVPALRHVEQTRPATVRKETGMFKKVVIGGALAVAAVVLGLFVFRFVAGLMDPHHKKGKDYIGYVTPEPHNKPVAIVFIHGIFGTNRDNGNDKNTWSGGPVDFTGLLANDPDVKERADIYEFGYYSPYTGEAQTITQTSVQLAEYLHHDKVFENHQQVVFVAHSMGGLILRKYLLDNREQVQDKVAMMFFFATPTDGSVLATIAQHFSNNPQIRGLAPLDANEALQAIQSGWFPAKTLSKKPSYCAYETLKTDNVAFVVSQASASALCTEQPEPITADHIGIVKPTSTRDESYIVLIDALNETVFAPKTGQPTSAPPPSHNPASGAPSQGKPTVSIPIPPAGAVQDDSKKRAQAETAAVTKFIGDNCTRDVFIDQRSWVNRKAAYEELSSVKQSSDTLGNSLSNDSPYREALHDLSVTLTRARSDAQLFSEGNNSTAAELTRDGASSVCRVRSQVSSAMSALETGSKSNNSCSKDMLCDTSSVLREWDEAHKPSLISHSTAAASLVKTLRKEDAGRVGVERVHNWRIWMAQVPPELAGKIVSIDYKFGPGFADPIPASDASIGFAGGWKAYPCSSINSIKTAYFDAKFVDGSTLHADFNFCGLPDGTAPKH